MAELADALDSESSARNGRGGSNPLFGTLYLAKPNFGPCRGYTKHQGNAPGAASPKDSFGNRGFWPSRTLGLAAAIPNIRATLRAASPKDSFGNRGFWPSRTLGLAAAIPNIRATLQALQVPKIRLAIGDSGQAELWALPRLYQTSGQRSSAASPKDSFGNRGFWPSRTLGLAAAIPNIRATLQALQVPKIRLAIGDSGQAELWALPRLYQTSGQRSRRCKSQRFVWQSGILAKPLAWVVYKTGP